jgi:hypothetical protein
MADSRDTHQKSSCCKGGEILPQSHPGEKGKNEAESTEGLRPYPLEVCIVSGAKLGSHGDPYIFGFGGQEDKLCCKGCLEEL